MRLGLASTNVNRVQLNAHTQPIFQGAAHRFPIPIINPLRMRSFTTFVCVLLLAHFASAGFSPTDFEKCHFDDASCFTKVTNHLLKTYGKSGVRELNIIPFDPLHVNLLKLEPNTNGAVNVAFEFKNIDLFGLTDAQSVTVSGFSHDAKGPIVIEAVLPHLVIKGPYSVDGTILGLPIHGKGGCDIALDKLKVSAKISTKLVKKGNDEFLAVEDVHLDFAKPDKVSFKFDGLFGGDKELSDSVHELINQNWPDLFNELRPGMGEAFALILKGLLKQVFDKHPYHEFFQTD